MQDLTELQIHFLDVLDQVYAEYIERHRKH